MAKYFFISMFFSFTFIQVHSQSNDWKLSSSKNGIDAYTRKVDNSKYLEYKIETQISSTVDETVAILIDTKNYKKIFPYLSEVELLRNDLPESYDVLVVIKTPFPVRNRIGVYTNQIERSNEEVNILISQNTDLIPDTKHVKITECYGSWNVRTISDTDINITHTFFADPGGSIPAWIINAFALKQPMKTFSILRDILESSDK